MAPTLPRGDRPVAIVPVKPQQPPPSVGLRQRFETGVVVRLGRSPFAGHHPAHLPGSTPRAA